MLGSSAAGRLSEVQCKPPSQVRNNGGLDPQVSRHAYGSQTWLGSARTASSPVRTTARPASQDTAMKRQREQIREELLAVLVDRERGASVRPPIVP